ncbi:MAG: sialate O-acetylesterase, partial [Prevotella sp.]|nr:sialate O-acetylesterase [Prevotella sp.]
MKKILIAICALMGIGNAIQAEVKLPKFFSDNMVLQQQTECNLWGTAAAGKTVVVNTSWDNKTYKVKAAAGDGRFELQVTTPAAGGPYDITFDDGTKHTLSNVLVGEVWICSGQSNMEMQMKGFKMQPVEGTTEELLRCKDKGLRLFTVKRKASLAPLDDVTGQWNEADAASVRDFSATAYYFGRALRMQLDVPVGLIVTAWGGSACEAW